MAQDAVPDKPEPSPNPVPEPSPAPEPTEERPTSLPRLRQKVRAAQENEPKPSGTFSDRFDKFTERAKKVLTLAQSEAKRFNHNYIGTEHILLGLVAEGEGIAAKALTNLNVGLDQVRSAVEYVIGRGDRMVLGDISLTPRAKKVIELGVDEARELNHNYIGTEHLLLGLIREGEGIAAGVLISLGVDMDRARAQVLDVISQLAPGMPRAGKKGGASDPALAPFAGSKDSVITCRIASDDLEALDALIEAGIRSTRSDAAAWLIHAGIQANLDLFDKVYTTVAEIKRLREQAQSAAKDLEGKGKPSASA
jgi:hypothetical protein